MNRVRTLPILLEPERGEALDSWLEALAHRLNTHLADLLIALRLVDRDDDQIHALARWNVRLRDDELARLASATGVTPDRFEAMTLSHYDGTALRIDPSTEFVDRHHLWGRARGSRFCPDCLAESGGRWQLSWRLGWSFACLAHHRLLADACPECGRVQRRIPHPVHVIPRPGYCAGPAPGRSGVAAQRCGADLSRASTLQLAAGHPALVAQDHLLRAVNSGIATFGVYRDHAQPAPAALSDVRALANRILTHAIGEELAAVVPTDLLAPYAKRGRSTGSVGPTDPANRPGFMAPSQATTMSVAVTAAFTVLGAADIAQAGAALRWLVDGCRRRGGAVSTTTIHSWGRGTTPTLTAIQLSALDPWLKPSDRLRYRSITPVPRAPVGAVTSKPRARHTPTLLWPEWSIRLALPSCHANHLRPALSCAVQMVGTQLRLAEAARRLGSPIAGHGISRVLQLLETHPHWTGIYMAIVRTADYLDTNEIPIDYERRRALDYDNLLPDDQWSRLCRETGMLPGIRKTAIVRSVLFERISGLPASRSPFASGDPDFRSRVAAFPADLTPKLAAGLDAAANSFLRSHGIHDEPVSWCPPLELLSDLDLPGPDPSSIDMALLHRLVREDGLGLRDTAARLDTTIDAIRYLLEHRPAPLPPQPGMRVLAAARAALGEVDLVDLYLGQQLTLREIASRIGVSRQTVARLAREYGIEIRPAASRRVLIERDWLYKQYVVNRRTLADLAREAGMSTANMARWAKIHNIPLRARGGASHHGALRASEQAQAAPRILRPALGGVGGWDRLHRFAATSTYPTLRAAAKDLNTSQSTLTTQINRLERDLGSQLLVRAGPNRSMSLTPFGVNIVRAIGSRRP